MKKFVIVYGNLISIKELKKLDPEVLKDVKRHIEEKLTERPEVFGKPLQKSLKGYRRMRMGNFRVIFKIENQTVKIVFIGKKPDVYQQFLKKMGKA